MSLETSNSYRTDNTAKEMFELILDRLENRGIQLNEKSLIAKGWQQKEKHLIMDKQGLQCECNQKRKMLETLDSKMIRIHKLLKNVTNRKLEKCVEDALHVIAEPISEPLEL